MLISGKKQPLDVVGMVFNFWQNSSIYGLLNFVNTSPPNNFQFATTVICGNISLKKQMLFNRNEW